MVTKGCHGLHSCFKWKTLQINTKLFWYLLFMWKCFYPFRSGLFQNDLVPIQEDTTVHRIIFWVYKSYGISLKVTRPQPSRTPLGDFGLCSISPSSKKNQPEKVFIHPVQSQRIQRISVYCNWLIIIWFCPATYWCNKWDFIFIQCKRIFIMSQCNSNIFCLYLHSPFSWLYFFLSISHTHFFRKLQKSRHEVERRCPLPTLKTEHREKCQGTPTPWLSLVLRINYAWSVCKYCKVE